jgi:hypothetical protein
MRFEKGFRLDRTDAEAGRNESEVINARLFKATLDCAVRSRFERESVKVKVSNEVNSGGKCCKVTLECANPLPNSTTTTPVLHKSHVRLYRTAAKVGAIVGSRKKSLCGPPTTFAITSMLSMTLAR